MCKNIQSFKRHEKSCEFSSKDAQTNQIHHSGRMVVTFMHCAQLCADPFGESDRSASRPVSRRSVGRSTSSGPFLGAPEARIDRRIDRRIAEHRPALSSAPVSSPERALRRRRGLCFPGDFTLNHQHIHIYIYLYLYLYLCM